MLCFCAVHCTCTLSRSGILKCLCNCHNNLSFENVSHSYRTGNNSLSVVLFKAVRTRFLVRSHFCNSIHASKWSQSFNRVYGLHNKMCTLSAFEMLFDNIKVNSWYPSWFREFTLQNLCILFAICYFPYINWAWNWMSISDCDAPPFGAYFSLINYLRFIWKFIHVFSENGRLLGMKLELGAHCSRHKSNAMQIIDKTK